MHIVLIVLMTVFGATAGFFLGAGNYGGFRGAIIPGIVAGLLVSVPMLREGNWRFAAGIVGCALVGSIVCTYVPGGNSLKRLCREQTGLVFHLGSYKLGRTDSQ